VRSGAPPVWAEVRDIGNADTAVGLVAVHELGLSVRFFETDSVSASAIVSAIAMTSPGNIALYLWLSVSALRLRDATVIFCVVTEPLSKLVSVTVRFRFLRECNLDTPIWPICRDTLIQ